MAAVALVEEDDWSQTAQSSVGLFTAVAKMDVTAGPGGADVWNCANTASLIVWNPKRYTIIFPVRPR